MLSIGRDGSYAGVWAGNKLIFIIMRNLNCFFFVPVSAIFEQLVSKLEAKKEHSDMLCAVKSYLFHSISLFN